MIVSRKPRKVVMTMSAHNLLTPEEAAAQARRGVFDDTLLAGSNLFDVSDEALLGQSPPVPPRSATPQSPPTKRRASRRRRRDVA